MARKGRLSATELKKELARQAKSAWSQPLALTRYHARWGRIVSYSMWLKKIGFDVRAPKRHPLLRLRTHIDQFIYGRASECVPEVTVDVEGFLPAQLVRALVLQIVHRIESPQDLYDEIDYNVLHRQFVGIEGELPDVEKFVTLVQTQQRNQSVLLWLKSMLREAPLDEVSTSRGGAGTELLDRWLADTGQR